MKLNYSLFHYLLKFCLILVLNISISIIAGLDTNPPAIEEKEEHHVLKFGKKQKTGHIQNGKAEQYKSIFTPELNKVFESKFPNALAKLGYL